MDEVRVFDMGRGGAEDLEVALPVSWARRVTAPTVLFVSTEKFGWHAHVHDSDGWHLLGLPWTDHVDEILRGEVDGRLPVDDQSWWDLDQGWWGVVVRREQDLFVAQTDLDALLDSRDASRSLTAPGRVAVGDAEVTWSVVSAGSWRRAWDLARASCERGDPAPTLDAWSC